MNFKLLLLLLLATIFLLPANAQNFTLPQLAPKSPNIAAIEKYGDIPVSLSTGVPQVSIPLDKIEVDGLSIPITLSYHCNGFQPREIASWVGYGWSLMVGGSISTSVNGLSDLEAGGVVQDYANLRSYKKGQMTPEGQYNYLEEVMNQTRDTEFDRYQLSLLGSSVSFFYDTTGKFILAPKSDIKIKTLPDGGFKVTDISGNNFFFQTYEGGSASDNGDAHLRQTGTGSTALLSKVVTRNGRVILFKYLDYAYNYNISNAVNKRTLGENYDGCGRNELSFSSTHIAQSMKLLDSIIFDGGYVKFLKSSTARADMNIFTTVGAPIPSLIGVKVVNSAGKTVNQFNLVQGYFGDNHKLKLEAIQEQVGSTVGRRWDFTYNTGGGAGFFSTAVDHWGYYNGAANSSFLPNANWLQLLAPVMGTADRTSTYLYAKQCVLKSVKYPTGGSTEFEYEPNQLKVLNKSSIDNLSDFLFWPINTFPPVTVTKAVGNSEDISAVGSFTLNSTTTLDFTWYRQLDRGYVSDAMITFTGPTVGVNALTGAMSSVACLPTSCGSTRTVTLPAGTYNWNCQGGEDTYASPSYRLVCNFELTYTYWDTSSLKPPFELPGVRIKRQISRDSTGVNPPMIREYNYQDSLPYVLFRNIPNYLTSTYYNIQDAQYFLPCGMEYALAGESVAPFVGSTIEYSKVTETFDSSGRGGKIEHTFMLSNDTKGGEVTQPQVAPLYNSWEAGNLVNRKTYKKTASGYALIKEEINNYTNTGAGGYMPGMKVGYSEYCTAQQFGNPHARLHRVNSAPTATVQFYQDKSTVKQILNDTIKFIKNLSYSAPNHFQLSQTEQTNSKGQSIRKKISYPLDYSNRILATTGDALAIRNMADSNNFSPIEEIQIATIDGQDYVIAATLKIYRSDKAVISKVLALKAASRVLLSSFVPSSINGSGALVKDPNYEERVLVNKVDEFGNIIEMQKKDDQLTSLLYDYNKSYMVAEVLGADSASIAYTSFEAESNGNFVVPSASRVTTNVFTGKQAYNLTSGSVVKTGLNAAKKYVISYVTPGSALTISGTQGSPELVKQFGGLNCYRHIVTGNTQYTVSGSQIIDELRLHPLGAQMTTRTYERMVGMTSICSANNIALYYEYDDLRRLVLVRDQNKNIVKKAEYQFTVVE